MSQFKLNPQVDTNKVFLIKRHDLDVRLDVEYYQPKHFKLLTRLSASQYPVKTLKEISKKIVDGPFGSSVKADDYVEKGIPFLRVADITHGDGTIELDGLIYISPEKHQEISRSTVFPNDVVIAKTGATMGAASIVPETIKEANIRGDLAAVIVNDTVFANYIVNFINTKIGQDLFWRLNSGATRGRVVISNLRKYPLVIPDAKKMVEINQFVDSAKIRKNQKEQQAQALLVGIDAYLLSELGITLPQQDNSLDKRIFKVQFKAVAGQRLDPLYFNTLGGGLFSSIYDYYKLSEIGHYFKSGFGAGKQDQVEEENGIIQIRPTNINVHGELVFHKNVYVPTDDLVKNSFLCYGDVLFNNTNSQELVGKTSFVDIKDQNLTYSNHITVIRTNQNNINPIYLQNVLNLYQKNKYFYSICTNWNNQSGVGVELLKSVKIPVPPINKQDDIVAHIQRIRLQAKQLQTEAAQILADAKAEVERMILGE